MINPVLETSEIPETMPDPDDNDEGCLSEPGEQFPTGRADWARVTGTDENGEPVTIEGNDFFARMLQHETDHLDGYLYLDRLTPTMRLESREAVKDRGWQYDGITKWDPTELKAEDV